MIVITSATPAGTVGLDRVITATDEREHGFQGILALDDGAFSGNLHRLLITLPLALFNRDMTQIYLVTMKALQFFR